MNRLLLLTGALALVAAAGPVLADDAPALHAACAAPAGAIVLTPGGEGFDETVETPVGALNGLVTPTEVAVGDVYVDLTGLPQDRTAEIAFTLSWDGPVSDYDLVTAGSNDLSTDAPESKVVPVSHCEALPVAVDVFLGAPTDVVQLTAEATDVAPVDDDF